MALGAVVRRSATVMLTVEETTALVASITLIVAVPGPAPVIARLVPVTAAVAMPVLLLTAE